MISGMSVACQVYWLSFVEEQDSHSIFNRYDSPVAPFPIALILSNAHSFPNTQEFSTELQPHWGCAKKIRSNVQEKWTMHCNKWYAKGNCVGDSLIRHEAAITRLHITSNFTMSFAAKSGCGIECVKKHKCPLPSNRASNSRAAWDLH